MIRILYSLRGREAKPASKAWNLAKTFSQTVVFWSVLLFGCPAFLYALEEHLGFDTYRFKAPLFSALGATLFLAGSALALWSCFVLTVKGDGTPVPFDCPSKLVKDGPYRYVRNPMAISGVVQGVGIAFYFGSPIILVYVAVGLLIAESVVRPWEENDLEQRFGETYRKYRLSVPRWFPRLKI